MLIENLSGTNFRDCANREQRNSKFKGFLFVLNTAASAFLSEIKGIDLAKGFVKINTRALDL